MAKIGINDGEPRNPIWPPNTKSLPLKPKLSSGCSSMHTKCIFRLILTHYMQDYLFRYKKKHNLKIKGNFRGQKVNIRSENGVLRDNRSS